MIKTIKWIFDEVVPDKLLNYIDFNFIGISNVDRDRIIQITMELYASLLNNMDDNMIVKNLGRQKLAGRFFLRNWYGIKIINYNYILNIIKKSGLIDRQDGVKGSNYCSASLKSKNDKLKTSCKWIKVIDVEEEAFNKNIEKELRINKVFDEDYIRTEQEWIDIYPEQSRIIKQVYKSKFDLDEVKDFLYQNLNNKTKKGKLVNNILINDYINRATRYNARIYTFRLTEEGRFYNPTAYIPSFIRHLLTIDGERLVELDIANSQPLLLSSFVRSDKFKRAAEKGTIYDDLISAIYQIELSKCYWDESEIKHKSREWIKVQFMKLMFGTRNGKQQLVHSGLLYKAMEYKFRGVVDDINELKANELLWKRLHRLEADVFIKELYNKNIDYIPVHDSVLIKERDVKIISEFLVDIYSNIGLKPTIKKNN